MVIVPWARLLRQNPTTDAAASHDIPRHREQNCLVYDSVSGRAKSNNFQKSKNRNILLQSGRFLDFIDKKKQKENKHNTELQRTDPGTKVTGEFSTRGHIFLPNV